MPKTVVVKGHVVGATTVEVEEPIPMDATNVEVVVHLPDEPTHRLQEIVDFLKSLPPGTRSKEDIDRQIEDERSS